MGEYIAFVLLKFGAYLLLFFGLVYLFYEIGRKDSDSKLQEALADIQPFEPGKDEKMKLVLIAAVGIIAIILWRLKK